MGKILTTKMSEEIDNFVESRRLFPAEQNGCYKGTRGTNNLLNID